MRRVGLLVLRGAFGLRVGGDGVRGGLRAGGCDWFEGLERRELLSSSGGVVFGGEQAIGAGVVDGEVVEAADLDGDGDLDVLVGMFDGGRIEWYENDGSGVFGEAREIDGAAAGVRSLAVVDLDGDGDLDVLSATSGDDTIGWYENDGFGVFGGRRVIGIGSSSVFAGDVDGDGDLDVLTAPSGRGTLAWYENVGDGGFGGRRVISSDVDGPLSVFAADLDGDDDLDVVLGGANLSWFENVGGGEFGDEQVISIYINFSFDVFVADVDGDGDLDVVSGSFFGTRVLWYENDGLGVFSERMISDPLVSTGEVFDVFVADVDGDGDLDVMSASQFDINFAGGGSLYWYENDGGGGFGGQRVIHSVDGAMLSVYAGDLDGDGDVDVLAGADVGHGLWWFAGLGVGPTGIGLSGGGVLEGSASGTVVGVLSAVDGDVGDEHTYELLDDAGERFGVVGDELVVVNGGLLDYETAASHELVVRVVDREGLAYEQALVVGVLDVELVRVEPRATVREAGGEVVVVRDVLAMDGFEGYRVGDVLAGLVRVVTGVDEMVLLRSVVDLGGVGGGLSFSDVVGDGGWFEVRESDLESIFGGAVADGEHVLRLGSIDDAGDWVERQMGFRVDRGGPVMEGVEVGLTVDDGVSGSDGLASVAGVGGVGGVAGDEHEVVLFGANIERAGVEGVMMFDDAIDDGGGLGLSGEGLDVVHGGALLGVGRVLRVGVMDEHGNWTEMFVEYGLDWVGLAV